MSPSFSQHVQDWAPVASAIATTGAVAVALFGESLRSRVRRPRLLVLPFDSTSADGWVLRQRDGNHIAFLRLTVKNVGRSEARDVEVVIEELIAENPTDDGRAAVAVGGEMTPGLAGRHLKWADRETYPTILIPAGTSRRFDLFNIRERDGVESDSTAIAVPLRLGLFIESESGRHVLHQTRMSLRISIAGSNIKPIETDVSVAVSGEWRDEFQTWSGIQPTIQIEASPSGATRLRPTQISDDVVQSGHAGRASQVQRL